jgi:hypothetical protein
MGLAVETATPQSSGNQPEEAAGESARAGERLRQAMRQARLDDAERSRVVAELRGAEVARLEMLRDELLPVFAEVPKEAALFDLALVPSERPRLFVDMIAFVEMDRDRRTYRFLQETRLGRLVLAEGERLEPVVEAITDYIARRLIERDKALAGDTTLARAARAQIETEQKLAARHPAPATMPQRRNAFALALGFLIEVLGSIVLIGLAGLGGWTLWKYLSTVAGLGRRLAGH